MSSINTFLRVSGLWGVIYRSSGCPTERFHSCRCCGFRGRGVAPVLDNGGL